MQLVMHPNLVLSGQFCAVLCTRLCTLLKADSCCWQGATVYPLGEGAPTELSNGQDIAFEEAAYELGPGGQGDYDSEVLRLGYSSLSTPYSTIDYNMATGKR